MVYAANLSKDPQCTLLRSTWGSTASQLGEDGYYTYSSSGIGSVAPTVTDDPLYRNNAGMVYVLSCVVEPAGVVPLLERATFLQEWEHSDGVRSLAYQFNGDGVHAITFSADGCTSIRLLRQAAYSRSDYEALLSLSLSASTLLALLRQQQPAATSLTVTPPKVGRWSHEDHRPNEKRCLVLEVTA